MKTLICRTRVGPESLFLTPLGMMPRARVTGAVGSWQPSPEGLILPLEWRLRMCMSARVFLILLVAEDTFQTLVQD